MIAAVRDATAVVMHIIEIVVRYDTGHCADFRVSRVDPLLTVCYDLKSSVRGV